MLRDPVPGATYRLQLHEEFSFADAADLAGYLADLGVTHAYLSPILQAAPGSRHGYDVVDHSRVAAELGGEDGFRYMAARLASRGIGLVVDVVPNHMGIPVPECLNRQLWSVLAGGQYSPHAHWFDVDWAALDGRMLMPILDRPLRLCLDELRVATLAALPGGSRLAETAELPWDEPVLCHQGHVLPLRPGTAGLPMTELLSAQHYRLDSWRSAAAELNWRRFFDISSLIAIRVEEPDVFAATHGLLLGLMAEGLIDGLRIDHPDGLADPRGYLRQLATASGGRWVVAEKILSRGEVLPADWECAGTTGYDALAVTGELFTDLAGIRPLTSTYLSFAGSPASFAAASWSAKRETAGQPLTAEVARLGRRLSQLGEPGLDAVPADDKRAILAELLAAMSVYRAYVVPGEPAPRGSIDQIGDAARHARSKLPGRLHAAVDLIAPLLLGLGTGADDRTAWDDLIIRFQQTSAAVQAKGVEDTAAYRWTRLVSANEVGADPDYPASSVADFHRFAGRLARSWPATMTTLSTHDAKRQEDVRARLAVLAESPQTWDREVTAWHNQAVKLAQGRPPDPPTEYLLWQTLAGAWPIDADRLAGYLRKAMREAKLTTSWTEPDSSYESAALGFAKAALADAEIADRIAAFVTWISPDALVNSLGAKLIQLTMPGVPDIYQGCELTGLSLVDPDNRRPVDYDLRRSMLASIDEDAPALPAAQADLATLDRTKLLVATRALRLRRTHRDWFTGDYEPIAATGLAASHAVAFIRAGQAVTIATRLPGGLRRSGGWRDTSLALPAGRWQDILAGAEHRSTGLSAGHRGAGQIRLGDLLARLPVALLVRAGDEAGQA